MLLHDARLIERFRQDGCPFLPNLGVSFLPTQSYYQLSIYPRTPNKRGLKPSYYTRHYTDEQKQDKLCKVVAPIEAADAKDERETDGPAPVSCALL